MSNHIEVCVFYGIELCNFSKDRHANAGDTSIIPEYVSVLEAHAYAKDALDNIGGL